MPNLQVEIVTPERKLFSDEASFVVLPAANGEMGVYARHEPVVTLLNYGSVRVTPAEGGDVIRYTVAGGYAQVDGEHVIILADRAATTEDMKADTIGVKVDEIKEQLEGLAEDDSNREFLENELKWYETLLHELTAK